MDRLNADGGLYLTHTMMDDKFTLRLCVGVMTTELRHVEHAWELIQAIAPE